MFSSEFVPTNSIAFHFQFRVELPYQNLYEEKCRNLPVCYRLYLASFIHIYRGDFNPSSYWSNTNVIVDDRTREICLRWRLIDNMLIVTLYSFSNTYGLLSQISFRIFIGLKIRNGNTDVAKKY